MDIASFWSPLTTSPNGLKRLRTPSVTRSVVVRFIKKEIICRYGLPRKIITDNATNLNNKMMKEMCEDFKIQHHNSMPYRPKMNREVEAANKNIKKIV